MAHIVVGFFGLSSLNIFMLLNCVLGASWMSAAELIGRIFVMIAASCGLFVAGCSEFLVSPRNSITLSTFGEYVMVGATQAYIASFYRDLGKCQLTLFYVADQK
jgi:hypothetical protein